MYRTTCPVQTLSDVLGDAVYSKRFNANKRYVKDSPKWLSLSNEEFVKLKNATHETHPNLFREFIEDVTNYHIRVIGFFPQMWSSTATGHDRPGTVAGQAMTEAYTVVLQFEKQYLVYIDSHFCYKIDEPNEAFFKDLSDRKMASLSKSKNYQ